MKQQYQHFAQGVTADINEQFLPPRPSLAPFRRLPHYVVHSKRILLLAKSRKCTEETSYTFHVLRTGVLIVRTHKAVWKRTVLCRKTQTVASQTAHPIRAVDRFSTATLLHTYHLYALGWKCCCLMWMVDRNRTSLESAHCANAKSPNRAKTLSPFFFGCCFVMDQHLMASLDPRWFSLRVPTA